MNRATTDATPKRRWLKFGLRSLFVLVTLVALAAAWLGSHVRRYHHEAAVIAKLSASPDEHIVTVLYGNPFKRTEGFKGWAPGNSFQFAEHGAKWLEKLLGVDICRAVVTLFSGPGGNTFTWGVDESGRRSYIYDYKTGFTDADMPSINSLRYLRFLSLEAHGVTDEGLSQLDSLSRLEKLTLDHTAITDQGLAVLENYLQLRILNLRATNTSDDSIDVISQCHRLEQLNLEMTNFTPDGVKRLQQALPNCKIDYDR